MSRQTEVSPASCEGELPVPKTWSTEFVIRIPSEQPGTRLRSGGKRQKKGSNWKKNLRAKRAHRWPGEGERVAALPESR